MRKVVLYELLSLDGVAEEPGNWMFDVDAAVFENLGRIIHKQSDILLGRKAYVYWVGYWPTSHVEPFASFINGTQKHVFSSKVPPSEWAKSTVVSNSAVPYVAGLKRQPGDGIGIHGSIDLARSLLRADLVDELRLGIAPTVAAVAGGCSTTRASCRSSRCWTSTGPAQEHCFSATASSLGIPDS
jgi:dihydrofolate reductase